MLATRTIVLWSRSGAVAVAAPRCARAPDRAATAPTAASGSGVMSPRRSVGRRAVAHRSAVRDAFARAARARRRAARPPAPPGRARSRAFRDVVCLRDARVVPALARRARLARASLPARARAPRRDPGAGRPLAPRRRRPWRNRKHLVSGMAHRLSLASCARRRLRGSVPIFSSTARPRSARVGSAAAPRGPPVGLSLTI